MEPREDLKHLADDVENDLRSRAKETTEDLGAKANEIKDQLVEKYRDFDSRYETSRDKVHAINNQAIDFIQENPAVAIVAAVGIGYVIGRLASRRWIV